MAGAGPEALSAAVDEADLEALRARAAGGASSSSLGTAAAGGAAASAIGITGGISGISGVAGPGGAAPLARPRKTKMERTGRQVLRKTSWAEEEGRLVEKVEYFDNTHTEFIEYQKRLQAEARRKRAVKSHEEERRDQEAEREKRRILKELEELQIRRREQVAHV